MDKIAQILIHYTNNNCDYTYHDMAKELARHGLAFKEKDKASPNELHYLGLVFDEWGEGACGYWSSICSKCADGYDLKNDVDFEQPSSGASCSIKGCTNNIKTPDIDVYHIDFDNEIVGLKNSRHLVEASRIHKRMTATQLADIVVAQPFGTVIAFGETDSCSDYPDELEHDEIGYWYGCYLVMGKLDNPHFVIDSFGGGATRSESLSCSGSLMDMNNPKLNDWDKEYIKDGLVRYFEDHDVSNFVYVGLA